MGMHFGLIAAKANLSEFRAAFSETWPALEVAASADGFSNADEIWSWKSANERFVSAREWTKQNPGSEVFIFCQDGSWAVLMDFRYVLAADEEALEKLSTRFGSVLSFIVETGWYAGVTAMARATSLARSYTLRAILRIGVFGQQQSRKDRKKVEMLFAHLKRIMKLDRLRLRGLSGARDEFLLAATAQNLRRMAKRLCLRSPIPRFGAQTTTNCVGVA